MQAITREQFARLVKDAHIRPRLVRDLRFVPEEITDWPDRELLAVTTRADTEGVLIAQLDELYVLPFEIKRITDKQTGRSRPITCDFCYTWQQGSNAASITFTLGDDHARGFLCCADLDCSLHVRGKTAASVLSRSQLHEDITAEQRIERLRSKLRALLPTVRLG